MARKNVLIKSKNRMSRPDAAAFLRQLADKVESGKVALILGTDEVSLDIPAQVSLEVKADDKPKRRGTKRSLEVELEWYTGVDGEPKADLKLG